MEHKQYDIVECIDGEPLYEEVCKSIEETKRQFVNDKLRDNFNAPEEVCATYAKQKLDEAIENNRVRVGFELYQKIMSRVMDFIKTDILDEYRAYLEEEREHLDKGE